MKRSGVVRRVQMEGNGAASWVWEEVEAVLREALAEGKL